jgi:hypothetical protein
MHLLRADFAAKDWAGPSELCQRARQRIPLAILMVVGFAALVLLDGLCSGARAQSGWDLPEFNQAREAYRRGDCRSAWDIVWPLAKQGNHEARNYLYGTRLDRMMAPGESGLSKSTSIRHDLTLAAYAALARARPGIGDPNHRSARIDIPNSINALALGANGGRVAQCYKSGTSFQECLDLAISLGVIQKFEDYARDVETVARETGVSAWCRPYPG